MLLHVVDVQYAAVLGGCSVANLSGFQKVSKSELHQLDEASRAFPRLQMNSVFLYWYRFLNGGKESMLVRSVMGVIIIWHLREVVFF